MIVYSNYVTFMILDTEVRLISDSLDTGVNTVAEVGKRLHYLGSESPTLGAAVLAWEAVNGRDLTDNEFRQVLIDNNILTSTIKE